MHNRYIISMYPCAPPAPPHLPPEKPLEIEPKSRRQRPVVSRLPREAEPDRVLKIEFADVVLCENPQRDSTADREVSADSHVAGEVRGLRRQHRLVDVVFDRAGAGLH